MWQLALPIALILLPLPFLVRRILPTRKSNIGGVFVPSGILENSAKPYDFGIEGRFSQIIPGLIWICLVIAFAGPQKFVPVDTIPASGREIFLALDLSGSMERDDFYYDGQSQSRLAAVKQFAQNFAIARRGDRVGLVVFADEAYVASPLTFDVNAVARAVEDASIGISGRSTAISFGLGVALKRLSRSDAKSRLVILLSDGTDTTGDVSARAAAQLAHDLGVIVHTIALGPKDLETDPKARDAVDIKTLREIAEISGGRSFRVRNAQDLQSVIDEIDRLEPSPQRQPPTLTVQEFWIWPGGLAFLLGGFGLFLRDGR